jgi:hypothetical protein
VISALAFGYFWSMLGGLGACLLLFLSLLGDFGARLLLFLERVRWFGCSPSIIFGAC